jgi:hypothetical protein
MWIFPLVGYIGVLFGFGFMTLAIASGLYYLSELVEEHTVLAKKLLTRLIYAIITVQALLVLVDGFPLLLSLLSIGSHAVYAGNLRHFPTVRLTDPVLVVSCALVVTNHFLWFRHFSTATYFSPLSSRYPKSRYDLVDTPTFTEIASYFGLCIWLVPFTLFVSLSAGENVLPSMGSEYATGTSNRGGRDGPLGGDSDRRRRRAKGLLKATIDGTMDWVGESAQLMGFWNGDQRRF